MIVMYAFICIFIVYSGHRLLNYSHFEVEQPYESFTVSLCLCVCAFEFKKKKTTKKNKVNKAKYNNVRQLTNIKYLELSQVSAIIRDCVILFCCFCAGKFSRFIRVDCCPLLLPYFFFS